MNLGLPTAILVVRWQQLDAHPAALPPIDLYRMGLIRLANRTFDHAATPACSRDYRSPSTSKLNSLCTRKASLSPMHHTLRFCQLTS